MTSHKKHHRYVYHALVIIIAAMLGLLIFFLLTQNVYSRLKIIDTHLHIETLNKAHELRKANANLSIEKSILIPSPIETITLNGHKSFTDYRKNVDEILKIAEAYPDNFVPFCTLSPLDSDAPEYFQDCVKRGGKGLKLYNGHSYYYEIFKIPLDSARMMPIYAFAERNNIPILYHVNIVKYGNELEKILKKFPDLVVSIPHFMVSSIKPQRITRLFDLYPNLYTDISFGSPQFMAAGLRRISQDPKKYIDLITSYTDRFLFGTDMVITEIEQKNQAFMESVLKCYRNMLEKKTYTCAPVNDYYKKELVNATEAYKNCKVKEGDFCKTKKTKVVSRQKWYSQTKLMNGLHLDSSTLQKVFYENAMRFLSL